MKSFNLWIRSRTYKIQIHKNKSKISKNNRMYQKIIVILTEKYIYRKISNQNKKVQERKEKIEYFLECSISR